MKKPEPSTEMAGFDEWFYSEPHRKKFPNDYPAYLAAKEAWQAAYTAGQSSGLEEITKKYNCIVSQLEDGSLRLIAYLKGRQPNDSCHAWSEGASIQEAATALLEQIDE